MQFGNGTLRLTTRQAYQLHGVLKQDLKSVFSTVVKNMGSTLGACGDVNRNVMSPPAPFEDKPEYAIAAQAAEDIADLLAPQSGAYYDVWLDGEKFATSVREVCHVSQGIQALNGTSVHTVVLQSSCAAIHAESEGYRGPQVQWLRYQFHQLC